MRPWVDARGERQAQLSGQLSGLDFADSPTVQGLDPRSLRDQAPQALPALQPAAFVKAREASDFEGTTERQFDHHLLHRVSDDMLLTADRKLGHGAAARWLTERAATEAKLLTVSAMLARESAAALARRGPPCWQCRRAPRRAVHHTVHPAGHHISRALSRLASAGRRRWASH